MENLRMINNSVLIKLDDRPDFHYNEKGEAFLKAVHYIEHWRFANSSGTVLAVPEGLTRDYDYGTTVEIQPGDIAIFNYLAIGRNQQDPSKIEHSKMIGPDYVIPYDTIYAVKRNDKVIPVNGWVIVEGAMEEFKSNFAIPQMSKRKRSKMIVKVRYIGTPNKYYRTPVAKDEPPETNEWQVGMTAVIPWQRAVPLQNEDFAVVETGTLLYRVQRKDMLNYDWLKYHCNEWTKLRPPVIEEDPIEKQRRLKEAYDAEIRQDVNLDDPDKSYIGIKQKYTAFKHKKSDGQISTYTP